MKTSLRILIILLAASLATACSDTPTDPELDAQWQLLTIAEPDGAVTEPAVRTYYCFYRHTVQLHNVDGITLLGNLTYVKDRTLTISFPDDNAARLRTMSLPVPADADPDSTGYSFTFTPSLPSSSRLILTDPAGRTLTFRKF